MAKVGAMRSGSSGSLGLDMDLAGNALFAGDVLHGMVTMQLDQPRLVKRLVVEAIGRELTKASARFQPGAYRYPVPRPAGRTRSGSAREISRVGETLIGSPTTLEAGQHAFRFRLPLPVDTVPSYHGINVVTEHELIAWAEPERGPRQQVWRPLHVWSPDVEPEPDEPVELWAPTPTTRRLARAGRAPVRLCLRLPSHVVDLGRPVRGTWHIENPQGLPLKHLVLELVGTETSRHLAATDVHHFLAARHLVRLESHKDCSGEVEWALPPAVAPTLRGPRCELEWRLDVAVTVPWLLGVTASAPLLLIDRLHRPPDASEVEKVGE
ncbi:MAG: hypothetical protein HZB16_09290 [Armatimonadetes bacterium]|nr:hypothetical protein [Armatimonadota bacterium]